MVRVLIFITQVMEQHVFSFSIKEQLMVMLQNVNAVNKELTRLAAASRVYVTQPKIMVSEQTIKIVALFR